MLDRRAFMLGAIAASFAGLRLMPTSLLARQSRRYCRNASARPREHRHRRGVSGSAGSRLFTYGASGAADNRQLDGDTVFEIASITKVLTALILAAMVERGEVAMSDPVGKYRPLR